MSRLLVETDGGMTPVDWFARDGRAYVNVDGVGQACVAEDKVFVRSGWWTADALDALARVCKSGPVADATKTRRLTVVD